MEANTRIIQKRPKITTLVSYILQYIVQFNGTPIGRQPVGLEVFLGSIAQLTNGNLKKASLVDIGKGYSVVAHIRCTMPNYSNIHVMHTINNPCLSV